MRDGKINEGGPPTTRDWNEHEARFDDLSPKVLRNRVKPRGKPAPIPDATPEQINGTATRLYSALRLCVEALNREPWDGRWGNRLMQAHTYGHAVLEDAAQWTQPEQPGTSLPSDADHRSVSDRQAEGGE
jgi:hypothetical protein